MKKLLIIVLFFTCKSYGQTVKADTLFVSEKINFIKIGTQIFAIEKSVKLTPVEELPLTLGISLDSLYRRYPSFYTPYYNPNIRYN